MGGGEAQTRPPTTTGPKETHVPPSRRDGSLHPRVTSLELPPARTSSPKTLNSPQQHLGRLRQVTGQVAHSHSMVPRWLARDVERHPVHLAHLVRDAGRDAREQVVREARPVGGHRVLARHRTQHDRVAVRAAVALHADPAHVGEQRDGALPDVAVQAGERSSPHGRSHRRRAGSRAVRASTAPTIRIASPGPGKGWRHTIAGGSPS